eukprot:6203207-Pleurochrysis_carterae.AAC.4
MICAYPLSPPFFFSLCLVHLLTNLSPRQMGSAAREHVEANFSREAFGAKLDAYLVQTKAGRLKAHAA